VLTPRVATLALGSCHVQEPRAPAAAVDHELRCDTCGARAFSSAAAELVAAHHPCPRCGNQLALASGAA
jgi:hypothetical protein